MQPVPRPSFTTIGIPPPSTTQETLNALPPRAKQILDAVNEINQLLALAYQSPTVNAHITTVTVQVALEMWQGITPVIPVTSEEINACEGVKAIFPIVKKLEAICDSIPMKVPVDHIAKSLWRLSDEFQIEMFGLQFCGKHRLLRGRLSTESERTHSTETRLPSFILTGEDSLDDKFDTTTNSDILPIPPPPSSPPPVINAGGAPLPPPTTPPPSLLPPPPPPPQTPGPISDEDIFKALQSSQKAAEMEAAANVNSFVVEAETIAATPDKPVGSMSHPQNMTPMSSATPSATSDTGGVNSPFPSPNPANTPSNGKSPMTLSSSSNNIKSPTAPKKVTSPWPFLATIVIPCLISLSFVFLTILTQLGDGGISPTAHLSWVAKNNATKLINQQISLMEAAHTAVLTSNNWKLIRSTPNVTLETMEIKSDNDTGKIRKYTKISAIFPEKPEHYMKNFHDFKTFDKQSGNNKDARIYFPFFDTAEFVLKSSSGATVMELTKTGWLGMFAETKGIVALQGKRANKALQLDNLIMKLDPEDKLILPKPFVIPHGTLMAAIVSVNAMPLTSKQPVQPSSPLIESCDEYGRILNPDATICSSLIKKMTLGTFHQVIDAMFWYVKLPAGNTLMIVVGDNLFGPMSV